MIRQHVVAIAVVAWLAGCGESRGEGGDVSRVSAPPPAVDYATAPLPVTPVADDLANDCASCHPGVVQRYRKSHGMANSLGPIGAITPGTVRNPHNGWQYAITDDGSTARLLARAPDGGTRIQRVVGRIGAGKKDVSLVTTEERGGATTGHLFFAPVEWLPGNGWELSPFEDFGGHTAVDFGLETGCIQCHSGTGPATLPGAARATDAPDDPWGRISPRNLLGATSFDHLTALSCDACHGDTSGHATAMRDNPDGPLGITPWDERSLAARRDACARCHMDGEARVDLTELNGALPPGNTASLSMRPVVVTAAPDDDFRFVAHHERMALSRCFTESADMTCMSCHSPHTGVQDQGTARFDARCMTCHDSEADASVCNRSPDLTVHAASAREARTDDGCVDCHVRRSQPFDLGHVTVADHFVRKLIAPPSTPRTRAFHDSDGDLELFRHDGWDELLATPEGQRWERGVVGMAYVKQGRFAEADEHLSIFLAPEHPQALRPTAPAGLTSLETSAAFHHLRGLIAEKLARPVDAERHYRNALIVDETHPGARLNLAGLLLARNDYEGAREHITTLLDRFPATHKAWNLMARFGAQVGDLQGVGQAFAQSASLWPSDAIVHREFARLLDALGERAAAEASRARARELSPSSLAPPR